MWSWNWIAWFGNNTDDQEGRQPKMPQEEMQYPVQTICVILGGSHGLVLPADFHFPSLRLIYISHFHTFILSVYVYWLLTHCQELLIPGTWGWNKSPLSSQLNPTLLHVVLMFATKVTLHSSAHKNMTSYWCHNLCETIY